MVTVVPARLAVPVRAFDELFIPTFSVTLLLPFPFDADGVSQLADEVAVQLHPAVVVIETTVAPPCQACAELTGVTVYEQFAPACVIVRVWPPAVMVAVRVVAAVLAVAVHVMVAPPEPLDEDNVSHEALDEAVQAQPLEVVSVTVPVPPFETMEVPLDESV